MNRPYAIVKRVPAMALLVSLAAAAPAHTQSTGIGHATGLVRVDPAKVSQVAAAGADRDFLPRQVDLSAYLPPVGDQGQQGSCAAWATSYAGMSLAYNEAVAKAHLVVGRPRVIAFSPAFTYNLLHRGHCGGTSLIDALEAVRDDGLLPLSQFPYSAWDCSALPNSLQQENALQSRLTHYSKIDTARQGGLDRIRGALQKHHPVVFGFYVGTVQGPFQQYSGGVFDSDGDGKGAHAMLLTGYDDDTQTFRLVNSWGPTWGDHGFMTITYRAFLSGLIDPVVYELDQIDTGGIANLIVATDSDPSRRADGQADVDPEPAPDRQASPRPPMPLPSPPVPSPPPAPPAPVVVPAVDIEASLRQLLAQPVVGECSHVDWVQRAGVFELSGYVPSLDHLKAQLAAAAMPMDRLGFGGLAERPWPQCEIRADYLERPLGTERGWHLNLTPSGAAGPVEAGRSIKVTVSNPHSGRAFVYVYYIQAFRDGNVVPLLQPLIGRAGEPLASAFGPLIDLGHPVAGLDRELRITPPVGYEAIVLVAARKPLFPGALAAGALNERELLTGLRAAIAKASPAGDLLGADAVFITTKLPGHAAGDPP